MLRIKGYLGSLVLGAAILTPLLTTGCARPARYYDEDHSDYHAWNDGETQAYKGYLNERHRDYRDFNRLNRDEQKDYWKWRHEHPDRH